MTEIFTDTSRILVLLEEVIRKQESLRVKRGDFGILDKKGNRSKIESHLDRLSKGSTEEERKFVVMFRDYTPLYLQYLLEHDQERYGYIFEALGMGESDDVTLWFTLVPFVIGELRKINTPYKDAIEMALNWLGDANSYNTDASEMYHVHLKGLEFYEMLRRSHPSFILIGNEDDISYQFAKSEAMRLVSMGYLNEFKRNKK